MVAVHASSLHVDGLHSLIQRWSSEESWRRKWTSASPFPSQTPLLLRAVFVDRTSTYPPTLSLDPPLHQVPVTWR